MTRTELPVLGARVEARGTRFAAFADAAACAVRLYHEDGSVLREQQLEALGGGYFAGVVEGAGAGSLYRFVLGERALPDPYARFLPFGVHGPAMVVDSHFEFRAQAPARALSELVIYELHVGTFTPEGTFAGAAARLPVLAELGVTCVELMPIAAFAGERGWGYDGVALFAPHAAYGTPDELRAFVDRAHALGLCVLLDVVYNHFGPAGNYLRAYAERYFTSELENAWGDAPDFTFPGLRSLVIGNALYWLREFRFDGLRLDATHAIVDRSPVHVLRELADRVGELAPKRFLIAEDERNEPELVTETGLDAVWADDFHHQVRVTLTRERDGYYAAYEPGVAGIARAVEKGFLYEGQTFPPSGRPRGKSARALSAENFVFCIQNHDQIGNRALGDRLSSVISPAVYRAVSVLLLCLPMTPLLFMGQEWAASTPFLYFTDHEAELGRLISEGRRREFAGFAAFADSTVRESIPDPQATATFTRSKLMWEELEERRHAETRELYRAALELRRRDPVLARSSRKALSARAVGDVLVVERRHGVETRLVLVNFGRETVDVVSLGLARTGDELRLLLASSGGASVDSLPAETAVVLAGRNEASAEVGAVT